MTNPTSQSSWIFKRAPAGRITLTTKRSGRNSYNHTHARLAVSSGSQSPSPCIHSSQSSPLLVVMTRNYYSVIMKPLKLLILTTVKSQGLIVWNSQKGDIYLCWGSRMELWRYTRLRGKVDKGRWRTWSWTFRRSLRSNKILYANQSAYNSHKNHYTLAYPMSDINPNPRVFQRFKSKLATTKARCRVWVSCRYTSKSINNHHNSSLLNRKCFTPWSTQFKWRNKIAHYFPATSTYVVCMTWPLYSQIEKGWEVKRSRDRDKDRKEDKGSKS